MVRVRIPGNALTSTQLRALAGIAAELGGGYGDVTTRGNIQIREIAPKSVIELLTRLADAGLSSRGAGADNVRNVTASPLAGIDAGELIDTRPLAKALQMYLANSRDLFGLPRKFNVSFDGGGRVSTVTDTNDIGFVATQLDDTPGVHFRVLLAGVTGHLRFAEDCGLLVAPDECVAVAAAMLRVFAEHGDRTDRKKARLCYVLDRLGAPRFLTLVQEKLAFPLRFVPTGRCSPRPVVDKHGHLGVHAQAQRGLSSIGVAIPVGRMTAAQMRALAAIADDFGNGELRVTVWQNIIVPNVADDRIAAACAAIAELGFATEASSVVGGIVACTGNTGCRFSATDTKGQAIALARHLDARVRLDRADQHPSHRLSAFVRAALHRRHRLARRTGARWRRVGRGLSRLRRRRRRARTRARTRACEERSFRRAAATRGAVAAILCAGARRGRNLPRVRAAP